MLKAAGKKDSEKSISDKLGINEKTNSNTLNDSMNNDGSEDFGAELNKITSKKKKLEKEHTLPQAEETMNPELSSENDI